MIFTAFGVNAQPKYGYVDSLGQIMIPFEYDKIGFFKDGFAWSKKDGKIGVIDQNNQIVIPFEYDNLSGGSNKNTSFNEGLLGLCKDGLCGYVDKRGEEVIPFIYEKVNAFANGVAWVKQYGYWGLIDKEMNELTDFKYRSVGVVLDGRGLSWVSVTKEVYGIINQKGEVLVPLRYGFEKIRGLGSFENGVAKWIKDGRFGYVDEQFNEVIPFEYRFLWNSTDGTVKAYKNGESSIIDKKTGEVLVVLPANLQIDGDWSENRIPVEDLKTKLNGYLDFDGNLVTPCIYSMARPYKNGYAFFNKQGEEGYLDLNGKEYPKDFFVNKVSRKFYRGLAVDKKGDKYGFVDERGNVVIPHKYGSTSMQEGFKKANFIEVNEVHDRYFINTEGERISSIHRFHRYHLLLDNGNRWIPQMNGKHGLLDSLWNQILPPVFNGATKADNGWVLTSVDDPVLLTQQKVVKRCIANRANNPKLPNPEIVISPMPFEGENLVIRIFELEKVWIIKQVGDSGKPKFKDITFAKSDGDIQTQLTEYFKEVALVANNEESCTCESIDWKQVAIPDNRLPIKMEYVSHTIEGANLLVKMKYVNNSSKKVRLYRPLLENGGVWSNTPFYRTMMDESIEECMFPPSMQSARPPNYFATYVIEAGEEQVFQMRFNQYKKSICSATDELIFQIRYTFPRRFTDQQKLSDIDFYNRMNVYKLDIVSEPIRIPLDK